MKKYRFGLYLIITTLCLFLLICQYVSAKEKSFILLFKVPGCPNCIRIEQILAKNVGNQAIIIKKQVTSRKNQLLLAAFDEAYQVDENYYGIVPKVFIGKTAFYGQKNITTRNLNHILEEEVDNQKINLLLENNNSFNISAKFQQLFASFTTFTVALGGLADGINPCSITTLLFFLSFLFFLHGKSKQMLIVGISFIIGTFLAYTTIGIGLFQTISTFSLLPFFFKIAYPLFTLITLTFCILSLRDYYLMKQGRFAAVTLQLPKQIKTKIHQVVHSKYFFKALPVYGFITGVLVSALEFLCTGQVYLPTIVYILSNSDAHTTGFYYLLIYNLFFILPLVIILLLIYYTSASKGIKKIIEKNLGFAKLFLACFFLIVTLFLAYKSFWIMGN